MTGTDQYRAPEVIFGEASEGYLPVLMVPCFLDHRATYATDCFSLGCLLGEIATGLALFPPCERGPLYEREKALLFNAISGPFSQAAAARIETVFPRTFDEITIKPICYKGLSRKIISEVNKAVPVRVIANCLNPLKQTDYCPKWMMEDMDIAEVVEGLVCTDPDQRLMLDELFGCAYFSDSVEDKL